MNDLRLDMPLTDEELRDYLTELNAIRKQINAISKEPKAPAELARKIVLYTDMQHVIGELYAQTVYDYSMAVLNRKNQQSWWFENSHGTDAAKKAIAEKETAKEVEAENKAKSNMKRWEMQYNNAEQKANALKKQNEVLFDDYRYRGGRSGG